MDKRKWEGIKITIVNDKSKVLFNIDLLRKICIRIIQQLSWKIESIEIYKIIVELFTLFSIFFPLWFSKFVLIDNLSKRITLKGFIT